MLSLSRCAPRQLWNPRILVPFPASFPSPADPGWIPGLGELRSLSPILGVEAKNCGVGKGEREFPKIPFGMVWNSSGVPWNPSRIPGLCWFLWVWGFFGKLGDSLERFQREFCVGMCLKMDL